VKKPNWPWIVLFVVIIVFFLVWGPADAQRGSAPVTVQNTDANPVPVSAPNSIPVTVMNAATEVSGTVNANQNGNWNVGISSSANTVKVENNESNPVLVKDIASCGKKTPFVFSLDYINNSETYFVVPENKMLILEYLNVHRTLWHPIENPILHNLVVHISYITGGSQPMAIFTPTITTVKLPDMYTPNGTTHLTISEPLSWRLMPNTQLIVYPYDCQPGLGDFKLLLTGYFEDAE
jgi:hypothetical protein